MSVFCTFVTCMKVFQRPYNLYEFHFFQHVNFFDNMLILFSFSSASLATSCCQCVFLLKGGNLYIYINASGYITWAMSRTNSASVDAYAAPSPTRPFFSLIWQAKKWQWHVTWSLDSCTSGEGAEHSKMLTKCHRFWAYHTNCRFATGQVLYWFFGNIFLLVVVFLFHLPILTIQIPD